MFHASKVCLYDEVDWSWGKNMEGSRIRLHLLCGHMWRRRIAAIVRGGVGAGTNQIRGPYRRNSGLFVVLTFRVSRRV